jgi:hypothetical protein
LSPFGNLQTRLSGPATFQRLAFDNFVCIQPRFYIRINHRALPQTPM